MASILFGFHAVTVRLKIAADSIDEIYVDRSRRDARMQRFAVRARQVGVRLVEVDRIRLDGLAGGGHHQGVVACVQALPQQQPLHQLVADLREPALLLVLDGVTDPHNLGACLRVADGAGAHAVIAPKDRAVGMNATVAKVSSGASESVPYYMVTNLARTLQQLKKAGVWVVGAADEAAQGLYETDLSQPVALVLGAEGHGLRRLTRERCDLLVSIPMAGAVDSLNVSVASGICLYEARRQRLG